ncbi:hypothetical protein UO65_4477 [Actinokineospora spheciospongiae]|uniref:Uncharacterized protein n=1 Tax=Actinokineospora spheciospongiae TaxID=909613 RepID=W7IUY9_9PSEU|nr:hypothetical protein [Actinokineospora spheciospongiae]EWC60231.1 hypothetical protein UO65_4477 [Actinokineospora spheciospongiae]
MLVFSGPRWAAAADAVADRALREVPFYRERLVGAGARGGPVPSAELADRLWALCPLASPFTPAREPTLWTGVPGDLAAAVRLAGRWGRATPVVEARRAWVPWTRLTPAGPAYAPVVVSTPDLDGPARARTPARPVLVAPPAAVAELTARLDHVGPVVLRLAAAEVSGHRGRAAVLFDPHLGYFAGRSPVCGHWHVLWRRFHVAVTGGALVVTALRRRRPTLSRIAVPAGDFARVDLCRRHRTPVLLSDPAP